MLDYEYIKNRFKLEAIDVKRQKELDSDVKAIQEIELVRQFNNNDVLSNDETQFKFALTILEKIKEMRLKFSQGNSKIS